MSELHEAAERGDQETVRRLLLLGAPVDQLMDETTALSLAVSENHIEVCRELLNAGANPEAAHPERACSPELLSLLVQHGRSPQSLFQPLFLPHQGARRLLELGACPNTPDDLGQTPLYQATRHSVRMMKLLLRRGADPLQRNTDGSHSLHFCAVWGYHARARTLLDHGVPADYPESSGRLALSDACSGGHYKVVRLLLERGADPGPGLELAAEHGSVAVVKLLLEHGASKTKQARSAAHRWLPDLLAKAKASLAEYGPLRHRWRRNSSGERILEVKGPNFGCSWTDGHGEIVELLS